MDLFASRNYRFQVGDKLLVVGPTDNVNRIAELMGNSVKRLDTPNIATIFIGIIIGIPSEAYLSPSLVCLFL